MSEQIKAVDATWATAERLAAVVVAGMIREAAYRGQAVSAFEIAQCVASDPDGETASYFCRSAADAVDFYLKLKADPELLGMVTELFSEGSRHV